MLNYEDASDAKILFSKKYTIMLRYNILPSMDILDKFLRTKTVSEKDEWFNNPAIVSRMGIEYAKFLNFAKANHASKDRGFLLALFNSNDTFLNVIAQREGKYLTDMFELPEQPEKPVPTSNEYDAVRFTVKKTGNKWIKSVLVSYWKFLRETEVFEKEFSIDGGLKETIVTIQQLAPNEVYLIYLF